ncbi:MAG: phospho-N-acetylmuramoyl-pentapeptide-transferase [Lachnospiraceae bacterium]|jgi:phospho-N-acetylmuramoyl-pentapeptide-transferase|nr:phospho-N-acetylmuramoyl-pentapeptide-transferase [Lachnospiraceae bacterium]
MSFKLILPLLVAFIWGILVAPGAIPLLRKLKMGQTERELGVKEHLKKAGTPTMGGIIIVVGFILGLGTHWDWSHMNMRVVVVMLVTTAFAAIGFTDDYLKVVKKRSDGLYPKQKFALQFLVTACFAAYMYFSNQVSLKMRVPFSGGYLLDIGIFAIPLLFVVVLGTVNGANFTDGLDGLATCVTIPIAVFFFAVSMTLSGQLTAPSAAMTGALAAFLIFNKYPAKVFMGDTGSLALGGFVASSAYIMQLPLFIILVGFIYLVEIISVILQVLYFKKTHGRRIFKMAPIHHHFELCGWSEVKVVIVFTLITIALCVIAWFAL